MCEICMLKQWFRVVYCKKSYGFANYQPKISYALNKMAIFVAIIRRDSEKIKQLILNENDL